MFFVGALCHEARLHFFQLIWMMNPTDKQCSLRLLDMIEATVAQTPPFLDLSHAETAEGRLVSVYTYRDTDTTRT